MKRNSVQRKDKPMSMDNERLTTVIELAEQMGRHKTGVIRYIRALEKSMNRAFIREGRIDGRKCFVLTKRDANKILEIRHLEGFSASGKPQLNKRKRT